jgi:hypothetical protein
MSDVKSKSVKKEQKIVEDEFLEDGEMFEEEEKFWEENKINEEQKMEVKEQKPGMKKQYTNLYDKYRRKREADEDVGDCKVYKKRSGPGYFQYACELVENDERILYEIYEDTIKLWTQ